MKELSINNLRPLTVGFDRFFSDWEEMFSNDFFKTPSNWPAYNIVEKKDNHYDIEVALAGFNKKDIKVSYADGQLSIESVKNDKTKERDENGNVIHQGIAKRYFKKSFSIADNCEVKNAELKDGLLRVSLERIIPEAQKPRMIDIK
jgi:molecular chaperone IbpA|tara:strand:+ start:146 stop:583 length:438 start_codon:yes stop_codon:yes gene_type:complete